MKIDVSNVLGNGEINAAYDFYAERFAGLRTRAIQRHLMTLPELHAVCTDTAVEKWRVFTDTGDLVGFATYSNILTSMPLIEPAFFQARWPREYAAKAIWYCGFVCVADTAPQGAFVELITRMYHQAAEHGGVISLDYCAANDRLARAVRLALHRVATERVTVPDGLSQTAFQATPVDTQTYWTYETAAPVQPAAVTG